MKKEIITIGEALIDFIPQQKGKGLKDVEGFVRRAGGAPANVAAAAAKLGARASVITQVGKDAFGDYIVETLEHAGVGTDKIFRTAQANTALAFVSLTEAGERSFSFYRKPCADLLLSEDKIQPHLFTDCYALHFCSVDLIESPMKRSHRKAIALAREAGAVISFDPNVRLPLFDQPEDCRRAVLEFLPYADIVKVSDDELQFLFGSEDIETVKQTVFGAGARMLVLTRGAAGSAAYTRDSAATAAGIPVQAVDTTGAGDSHIGAFLFGLLQEGVTVEGIDSVPEKTLQRILEFAGIYSVYTTTKPGAIEAMATRAEIKAFIQMRNE